MSGGKSLRASAQARTTKSDADDQRGVPRPRLGFFGVVDERMDLELVAGQGPQALTQGPIAEAIVAAVQREPRPGTLQRADLTAFAPRRLEPLCAPFRTYRVCTLPSPSSANAMLSILVDYEMQGRSLSEWSGLGAALQALQPSDVADFVKPCIGHEIIAVAGPDSVRPALESLGVPISEVSVGAK